MTKRLTNEELADLGRLEAAVRGKWSCVYDGDESRATLRTGSFSLTSEVSDLLDPRVHELSLACAARNALPSLLAEIRELRAARLHDCPHCPCEGGVREPTIKDVDAESRRVFGRKASAEHNKAYDVVEVRITRGASIDVRRTYVSVPEAFGALRALPDYEGER